MTEEEYDALVDYALLFYLLLMVLLSIDSVSQNDRLFKAIIKLIFQAGQAPLATKATKEIKIGIKF